MVYSNRFVVSVLVDGQVQEERPDGSVEIPFGVEYALRLRNKHRDRRAVVKLFIDGEEQSKGGYVIGPNDSKVIERNSYVAKKFKFISSKTTEAQDHGKDKFNEDGYNGVIEARFYLEKEQPKSEVHYHHHHHHRDYTWRPLPNPYYNDGIECDVSPAGGGGTELDGDVNYIKLGSYDASSCTRSESEACSLNMNEAPKNDITTFKRVSRGPSGQSVSCSDSPVHQHQPVRRRERRTAPGVTVEGGYSTQTFRTCVVDTEDQFVSIKVLMKGFYEDVVAESGIDANEREVAEKKN
jgi:hypothetical protein